MYNNFKRNQLEDTISRMCRRKSRKSGIPDESRNVYLQTSSLWHYRSTYLLRYRQVDNNIVDDGSLRTVKNGNL
jgi:hypothetical protein